mmetsp:Transcript_10333/g.11869  ORF Transcript_10333/g.11869 Transcript_10333/m.11869 type:complete len:375 (-) Transcript_10333:684-1808(-)
MEALERNYKFKLLVVFFFQICFLIFRIEMLVSCLKIETATKYHRYVQWSNKVALLLLDLAVVAYSSSLPLSLLSQQQRDIKSYSHGIFSCVSLISSLVLERRLLQWYYKVSPARRDLMKKTYSYSSFGDKVSSLFVYAILLVLPAIQTVDCVETIAPVVLFSSAKEFGPFVSSLIGAIIFNNLVVRRFVNSSSDNNRPKQAVRKSMPATKIVDSKGETVSNSSPKQENALHDNIRKKGENSYYYAHGNTGVEELNRGEAPRLLSKSPEPKKETPLVTSRKVITNYAFIDTGKTIRVYVNRAQFQDINENANPKTVIDWEDRSVTLLIGTDFEFRLPKLYYKITGATSQYGKKKLVLILQKSNPDQTWDSLQKSY